MQKHSKPPQNSSIDVVLAPKAGPTYAGLVNSIGRLLEEARTNIAHVANTTLAETYWQMGCYIVEYEQNGADRARYGERLLANLTRDLTREYGKGFGKSNLVYMRKFYMAFPKGMTPSYQLSWSHYLEILKSDNPLEIEFYCKACSREQWSIRELRRQRRSLLFHRIAAARADDAKAVLELARKGTEVQKPTDILRDPYVLEFAGIPAIPAPKERVLEKALLENLKDFLLELGKGFSFVGSQYRIPLNTQHPCAVDLVFYNFMLKCFVLIDLKRGSVEHGDVGQMNLYLNYFKAEVGAPDDNEPVGIILGTDRDDLVVQYATQGISNRLFVSRYQLYLPDPDALRARLARLLP